MLPDVLRAADYPLQAASPTFVHIEVIYVNLMKIMYVERTTM